MRQRLKLFPLLLLLAMSTNAIAGEEFWEVKPVETWSSKEVAMLLGKSPWAKQAKIRFNDSAIPPLVGWTGAPGGGPIGAPGEGMKPPKIVIRWQSAAPIQLALQFTKAEKELERMNQEESFFIISAIGFPPVMVAGGKRPGQFNQNLLKATFLIPKTASPIKPSKIEELSGAEGLILLFFFFRADKILPEEKEIEFISDTGFIKMQAKFSLNQMIYKGKREL